VIYLGFISLGLPDGTLGVAWPSMHQALVLPIGLAGTLLLVVTLLSAIASFCSARIIERFQTGPVVLVSCAFTGTALLMVAHAQNLVWLLIAAVPLGFGAGAVDAGLNGYVARHYSGRHMNWLHACWGLGATGGPLIMAHALGGGTGWRGGYIIIALVQLSLAVVFLLTLPLWGANENRVSSPRGKSAGVKTPTLQADTPAGWLSAAILAIYVGFEIAAGLWAGSILVESRGIAPATAGFCVSIYYGAITVGRLLVGFAVERCGSRPLVTLGILLALAGACLFAVTGPIAVAAAGLVLLGLGFAPVYPGLMHEVPRRFAPESVQIVIGRQTGAAYIGGALLPALAGGLATVSLESIAWAVVGGVMILFACVRRLDRLT
jgi:MFS family permease